MKLEENKDEQVRISLYSCLTFDITSGGSNYMHKHLVKLSFPNFHIMGISERNANNPNVSTNKVIGPHFYYSLKCMLNDMNNMDMNNINLLRSRFPMEFSALRVKSSDV